ncbi:MAG TPA: hypothetical protein VF263_17430 [Longimicrobiaceae bacterium]
MVVGHAAGSPPAAAWTAPTGSSAPPAVASHPVVADAGAARVRRSAAEAPPAPAVPPATGTPGAGRAGSLAVGRPVPVVRAAPAGGEGAPGRVQRSLAQGGPDAAAGVATHPPAAPRLVHTVSAAAAAPGAARVQRQAATTAPPAGAPPAELPTVTAPGAQQPSGGGEVARIADQVYTILVRRLENERKQRGW